jgi:hypothetical protein
MPCTVQKTFAIAAATGNALLVRVKDNQPRLLESLTGLCAGQSPTDHLDTVDRHAHGREEHRRVEVFTATEELDPGWRPFITLYRARDPPHLVPRHPHRPVAATA